MLTNNLIHNFFIVVIIIHGTTVGLAQASYNNDYRILRKRYHENVALNAVAMVTLRKVALCIKGNDSLGELKQAGKQYLVKVTPQY